MEVTDIKDKNDKNKEVDDDYTAADFEKAMDATGLGLFNVLLLVIALAAQASTVYSTSVMSYILPIAECDLKLSLFDKGILNAITYAGMMTSAVLWGYLSDTQGRKMILVYCFLADSLCVFGTSLSQNFQMLVAFKFFGGFFANGPSAVLFPYLSEMHSTKHRPRVMMIIGMIMSLSLLELPLLTWGIFPRDWDFVLFGVLNVHTWQIFLFVCGIPSLIGGLAIIFLPESPKFLMSQGRNQEALRVFQKIYAINTRKPSESYPIRRLVEEVPDRDANANEVIFTIENAYDGNEKKLKRQHRSFAQALADGMQQIKPMFRKPLLGYSVHVYTMQFCILLGLNTIRLWLPQLFASIAEYEAMEKDDDASSNMCTILEYSKNKTATVIEQTNLNEELICDAHKHISVDLYANNIIVALTGLIGFFLAGSIIRAIGAKRLLTSGLIISGVLGMSLYWSANGLSTVIISSAFITISSISTNCLIGLVVNLFPTSMRTLIIAIAMLFGRMGALSGNLLFPIFVEIGCVPPFLMVGFAMIAAGLLSIIIPSGKNSTFT